MERAVGTLQSLGTPKEQAGRQAKKQLLHNQPREQSSKLSLASGTRGPGLCPGKGPSTNTAGASRQGF